VRQAVPEEITAVQYGLYEKQELQLAGKHTETEFTQNL
jgi:hypothetical protein